MIIETLLSIKNTIEENQTKYKQIINMFNHDIEKCKYCEGTGNYKRFIGNDCNGSHYNYEKCTCVNGWVLISLKNKGDLNGNL